MYHRNVYGLYFDLPETKARVLAQTPARMRDKGEIGLHNAGSRYRQFERRNLWNLA